MIVIDSSVALGLLHREPVTVAAVAGRRLAAPHLIDAEVAHALRGLVLGRKLAVATAEQMLRVWAVLAVRRLPMAGLLERAWELCDNLTCYDALFVATAEVLQVPLVTADRRLTTAPDVRCRIELLPAAG